MVDCSHHSLPSTTMVAQDDPDLKLNQTPEALKTHQNQQNLSSKPDGENDNTDEDLYLDKPQKQLNVQVGNAETLDEALGEPNQGPAQDREQIQNIKSSVEADLDLTSPGQEEAEEVGNVPALLITEAVESCRQTSAPVALQRAERPPALVIPAAISITSLNSSADGGDMNCCDLLSPRSDSFSLTSELTVSRRSEEDDTRSVAASSVMSLFHRVQMDPLEKDWLKSSALGNVTAQHLLLAQEPSLVLKKDFITGFTALHWAAKQGRQEAVDMMLRFGADVNARSHGGYTALHLASIHGHQHIIQTLISTYSAKTNIRDYHGKMAVHYWSGCTDVFNKPDFQSAGRFCREQRTQRFGLPSFRLSRSRSQGQLHLEFGAMLPQSGCHEALDLHV